MAWTVELDPAGPYITVRSSGHLTVEEVRAAFDAGLQLAQEHDVWAVLSDSTAVESAPSPVDLYEIAERLAHLGVSARFRQAVLLRRHSPAAQITQFWENTTLNRGLRVRVFVDADAARSWLLSGRQGPAALLAGAGPRASMGA